MPRLSTTGKAVCGVGQNPVSIDGAVPSALATYKGGFDWKTPTVIVGAAEASPGAVFRLYEYDTAAGTVTNIDPDGANDLSAGGGVWAAWLGSANTVRTSVAGFGPLIGAGLLDVSESGLVAVVANRATANGLKVYDNTGTLKLNLGVTLTGVTRVRAGVVAYRDAVGWHVVSVASGQPVAGFVGRPSVTLIVPFSAGGVLWLAEYDNTAGVFSLRKAGGGPSLVLPPSDKMFGFDAIGLSGHALLAWATGQAEGPAELVTMNVDLATGTTTVSTVVGGALVPGPGPTLSGGSPLVVGFPDVCDDGFQVIGEHGAAKMWFGGEVFPTPSGEKPLFVRAALVHGEHFAVYKGGTTDTGYLMKEDGTEVALGPTFGNQCVGLYSLSGKPVAVWVESQSVWKSQRFDSDLTPLEPAQVHAVPPALVGHMATGFLDISPATLEPIWTDTNRLTTVRGTPLIYAVQRGDYYVGQLGGGFEDQIVAVNAKTGAKTTLYEGLGLEPHAALSTAGDGTVFVAFRTLGTEGAKFTRVPLSGGGFTGTEVEGSRGPADYIPLPHPVVDKATDLRITKPWADWARRVADALQAPINLATDVVGQLPPSNLQPSANPLVPSDTVAPLDGTEDAGIAPEYSRGDHKHEDVNRPTDDEKAAMQGTAGHPSDLNRYVTDDDPRLVGGGVGGGISYVPVSDGAEPMTILSNGAGEVLLVPFTV